MSIEINTKDYQKPKLEENKKPIENNTSNNKESISETFSLYFLIGLIIWMIMELN